MMLLLAALALGQLEGYEDVSEQVIRGLEAVTARAGEAKTVHFIEKDTEKGQTFEYWIKKPNLRLRRDEKGVLLATGPRGTFTQEPGRIWKRLEGDVAITPGLSLVFTEFFGVEPYSMTPYGRRARLKWNGKPRSTLRWEVAYGEPAIQSVFGYFDAKSLQLMLIEQRSFMDPDIPEGVIEERYAYLLLRWNERMDDSLFGPAAERDDDREVWERISMRAMKRLQPVFSRATRASTVHFIEKDTTSGKQFEYWCKKPDLVRRQTADGSILVNGPGGSFTRTPKRNWQETSEQVRNTFMGLPGIFTDFFGEIPYELKPYGTPETLFWNGKPRKTLCWTIAFGEPSINFFYVHFDEKSLRLLLFEYRRYIYPDIPEGVLEARFVYPYLRWNEPIRDSFFGPAAIRRKRG